MLVKICGIKTSEAAETAIQAGVDLLGFVFAASKRQITATEAAMIIADLPPTVKKVGVFVNETLETMLDIAETVGLDYIQLHGDEPPSIAKQLPYKVIKAFSIDDTNLQTMETYPCDFYLLDSPVGKYRGGNGKTFNWSLINDLSLDSEKIILAGGLTPENIQKARKMVNPAGVDVSSGVETNGEKDPIKIADFIKKAKQP